MFVEDKKNDMQEEFYFTLTMHDNTKTTAALTKI